MLKRRHTISLALARRRASGVQRFIDPARVLDRQVISGEVAAGWVLVSGWTIWNWVAIARGQPKRRTGISFSRISASGANGFRPVCRSENGTSAYFEQNPDREGGDFIRFLPQFGAMR